MADKQLSRPIVLPIVVWMMIGGTLPAFLSACSPAGIAKGVPSCIRQEIIAHKDAAEWETGTVEEYVFRNKTVYAFLPDGNIIADGSTTIKDGNCNTLCHIGGFGGQAVNQCEGENFYTQAVFKRTIWSKKGNGH